MKTTELRQGNLLKVGEQIVMVTGVIAPDKVFCKNVDSYYECTYDIDMVEPIPLTKEWVKAFGLINGIFTANEYVSIAQSHATDKEWGIYFDDEFSAQYIKNIHQLQNLYFALTDNELTISSPHPLN